MAVLVWFVLMLAGPDPTGAPQILTRAEWKAAAPIREMKRHDVVRITIHHLGSVAADTVDAADFMRRFQKWCQTPQKLEDGRMRAAWADIPYHFIVLRDGTVCQAREAGLVGDTNTPYNPTGHLLICLAGDLEKQPLPQAQYDAVVRLCAYVCSTRALVPEEIKGHRDFAETDCPGKNMPMDRLRTDVAARVLKGCAESGVSTAVSTSGR